MLLGCLASISSCKASSCHRDATEEGAPRKPRRRGAAPSGKVDLCMLGVRAMTEYAARCEDALPWWGSIERAVEQLRRACESMVNAPGVHYERGEIEACVNAIGKLKCGAPNPPECRFYGTLSKGAPCVFNNQCAEGLLCKIGNTEACGRCATAGKEGESCGDGCDEGLVCIDDRCGRPRGVGERCRGPYDCNKLLRCAPDPVDFTVSTCKEMLKEGAACGTWDCAPSLRCEAGVCKKRPPPGAPGEKCVDPLDCRDFACVGGSCVTLAEEHEACADLEHPDRAPCAPSLACLSGKCKLRDPRSCP